MKICVLGAGVIGVSTAYALARLGHDVIVIDKNMDVAGGASRANGAQLSFSYVEPFASPTTLKALPRYLAGLDPALRLQFSTNSQFIKWGMRFVRQCSQSQYDENFKALAALSRESQQAFELFESELPRNVLRRTGQGKLVLISDPETLKRAKLASETYKTLGLEHQVLTKEACQLREPALKDMTREFLGGIYAPSDSALDPVLYCQELRSAVENLGGEFKLGQTIKQVKTQENKVSYVETEHEDIPCDAVIVCLGNGVNDVIRPHGVSVPVYPVQGYSLTVPVTDASPKVSVTHLKEKVVFANLGRSIRIAGFTDTNLSAKSAHKRGLRLHKLAQGMWPSIAAYKEAVHWTHYRPMTPSGTPVVGKTKVEGLFVNAGHGALGYTFAAGCAMRIARHFEVCDTYTHDITGDRKYAVS